MLGPDTIYFSKDTKIGRNVTIEPFVVFGSKVKVGNNVTISLNKSSAATSSTSFTGRFTTTKVKV